VIVSGAEHVPITERLMKGIVAMAGGGGLQGRVALVT
jgi:hypothetical protein